MSRLSVLMLSALGWAGFALVTVWAAVFLADVSLPRTVDGPIRVDTWTAVTTDLGLVALFALQHSLMARRTVKARAAAMLSCATR